MNNDNYFCRQCHALLHNGICTKCNPENKIKINDFKISNSFIYSAWKPPAPITVYSKLQNIPYGVVKYNLSKGLCTNKIKQIEFLINNHTYCCKNCSYYTNFDNELCYLKKTSVSPDAICKSFEIKPELSLVLKEISNESNNLNKKTSDDFIYPVYKKLFASEKGVEHHRTAKKH